MPRVSLMCITGEELLLIAAPRVMLPSLLVQISVVKHLLAVLQM